MYCHNPNATQVKAKFDINMTQCQQYISCCLLDCDQILNLGFLDKKTTKTTTTITTTTTKTSPTISQLSLIQFGNLLKLGFWLKTNHINIINNNKNNKNVVEEAWS